MAAVRLPADDADRRRAVALPEQVVRAVAAAPAAVLVLALAACLVPRPSPREPAPPLWPDDLRSAVAAPTVLEGRRVRLEDGSFLDASTRVQVVLAGPVVLADLDGDGARDAATVLVTNTGGTGNFRDLAVFLARPGGPYNAASASLGDRTRIQDLSVEGREIVVRMVVHGPADPMCCPSLPVTRRFRLEGGALAER